MNINRRLINLARDSRVSLMITILAGALGGILTIGQAHALSLTVNGVYLSGQSLQDVSHLLRTLLFIIAGRGTLAWISEVSAKVVAVHLKTDLRQRLFSHIIDLGPAYTRGERTGELTTAAVDGIEALDAYFSQYLPQLALAAIVPLSILLYIFPLDPLSGLILFLTAPLIPVFMILIGKAAETLTDRQYVTISRLSAHFLDSLQGLTTLKLFGQSKIHSRTIEHSSQQFRDSTMNVLRVTFLSALVLELVATLSTAVIAVEIGLRLLYSKIDFTQAFFLLILAPEFYIPLRMLGLRFHAGMNGTSAARKIFSILDIPATNNQGKKIKDQGATQIPYPKSHITFSNVTFTYPDETTPVLQDINLEIQPGQNIALVGISGSGKSTLAQILLGFISPIEGQILVDGRPLGEIPTETWRQIVAWVPQKPFIFNTSISENIRLGNPEADMDLVVAAARAAYLHEFITSLPDGYETQVGEAGTSLSSGQAQRLALARAFLRDAPVLILDEPTSYLDPDTEVKLEASTQKLMRRRTARGGRRRMVITIAHRLNTIYQADQIIVLQNGQIVERGTHSGLVARSGVYAKMVGTQKLSFSVEKNSQGESSRFRVKRQHSPITTLGPENLQPANIVLRLLGFLKGSWGRVSLSVLIGVATILSGIGLIGTSSWLISAAALHPSIAELQVAIVGVRFFGISRGIFRYLERLVSHDITLRLLSRLRTWVYRVIEPLAPARLMTYRSGDLLSRVVADVNTLENFYIRVVSPVVTAVILTVGTAAYLGQFDTRMGWTILAFLFGLGMGLPILIQIISRSLGRELVSWRARLHTQLVDGIQGLSDLLAYGRAADHLRKIERIGQHFAKTQQRMAMITGINSGFGVLLPNLGMWTVLILGTTAVNAGTIPGVMLASLVMIALVSFESVASLPLTAQIFGEITESSRRLFALVDTKPEVKETGNWKVRSRRVSADGWYFSNIKYSNLSFTYPGEHVPVLDNINFSLSEGKSLAIVGPSGAGKSTLLNLLLRFWEYHNGDILINDRSLHSYTPEDVRARMAVIPQNSYFFNASVRDNLRLARPDASESEIENAARLAQIHEFIARLPKGYDTFIGEQGLRLSDGERQRLAIGRSLIKDAPILILDEPTANLDPITERQVLEIIFSLMRGRTRYNHPRSTLLITHRLIGLENVDEILVLNGGNIVERGTQAELLHSGGLYRHLRDMQNRMFAEYNDFTNNQQ